MSLSSDASPASSLRVRSSMETIVSSRRTWKNIKGKKNEPVWPPHIEAALIEALESYNPGMSASKKLLGRFPRRNRFISDYIYKATQQRRSPKQVGSRIQQLRDTCTDSHIQSLLSRTRFLQDGDSPSEIRLTPTASEGSQTTGSPVSLYTSPFPPSSSSPVVKSEPLTLSNTPDAAAQEPPTTVPDFSSMPPTTIIDVNALTGMMTTRSSFHPSNDSPTSLVTFALPDPSLAQCPGVSITTKLSILPSTHYASLSVLRDGVLTHAENTGLSSNTVDQSSYVVDVPLTSASWDRICSDAEPQRYSVIVDVVEGNLASVSTQDRISLSILLEFFWPSNPPLEVRAQDVLFDFSSHSKGVDQMFTTHPLWDFSSDASLLKPTSDLTACPNLGELDSFGFDWAEAFGSQPQPSTSSGGTDTDFVLRL